MEHSAFEQLRDDDDEPVVDYSQRIVIDPPLTCGATPRFEQGNREICGRPAPIGRIWPDNETTYVLMPHCEDCDADYSREYAGRQAPDATLPTK